jgi:hypothetical protein
MKKISKHLIAFAILALLVLPVITVNKALAQDANTTFGITNVDTALNGSLGKSGTDPRTVIGNIINIALGFLGVIAVGIVLFGGFKWMTAVGNEDKVEEAKKVLSAGVIGLLIVLSAWALATYAIGALYNTTQISGGA